MQSSRVVATGVLSTILVFLVSTPLVGQEHVPDSEDETAETTHSYHPNHFGGFMGVSAHSDADEVAPTLGLEYARRFSQHWAAVVYTELVSSQLERDVIVTVGAVYYPMSGLGLVLAAGAEMADKPVDHNGEIVNETEWELLLRVGVAYGFALTPSAGLGPSIFVDKAGDRTTFVLGLAMVVGF